MSTRQQRAHARRQAEIFASPGAAPSPFNSINPGTDGNLHPMFGESAGDFATLDAEYRQLYAPANPVERCLVDTLVNNDWRLRRLRCVEADLWAVAILLVEKPGGAEVLSSGEAFVAGGKEFDRVQRTINACERNYHRALKELRRCHAEVGQALPPANPPQPAESKPSSPNLAPVRHNPNPPAPAPLRAAQKETPEMDDETFRRRKAAIFADSMAKYGRK